MCDVSVGPGRIGSWKADDEATAWAIIKWLRKVNRRMSRELAKELESGTMSAHEVILYVENVAGDLLPEGLALTCQPIYKEDVPKLVDENGEPIDREGPIGYAYAVEDEDGENDEYEEETVTRGRTAVRKSEKPWLERRGSKRRRVA